METSTLGGKLGKGHGAAADDGQGGLLEEKASIKDDEDEECTGGTIIHTIKPQLYPGAAGLYSPAILANKMLFLSGVVGLEPGTTELVGGGFGAEMRQIFYNLDLILRRVQCICFRMR